LGGPWLQPWGTRIGEPFVSPTSEEVGHPSARRRPRMSGTCERIRPAETPRAGGLMLCRISSEGSRACHCCVSSAPALAIEHCSQSSGNQLNPSVDQRQSTSPKTSELRRLFRRGGAVVGGGRTALWRPAPAARVCRSVVLPSAALTFLCSGGPREPGLPYPGVKLWSSTPHRAACGRCGKRRAA
jgi:hypothetical protein